MTTINHALWGMTIGRLVGLPIQGAIVASAPDLFSVPILGYYYFHEKKLSNQVPKWAYNWYAILHNWFIAVFISSLLFIINIDYLFLGIGYFWHVVQDAFLHTDYSTMFLFPLSKKKIQFYSASEHKWVQIVDIIAIVLVNIMISKFSLRLYF